MAKDREFEQQTQRPASEDELFILDMLKVNADIQQLHRVFEKAVHEHIRVIPIDTAKAQLFKLFTAGVMEGIRLGGRE